MLSLLISLSLFILIGSIQSLETIQVTLASTVELPCSISHSNDSNHPAKIVWIRDDHADIVSLDSVITVRDRRLSVLTIDSPERKERTLRIIHIEEQDQGLYRCVQGDLTLNEILLDVLVPPHIVAHSPAYLPLVVREGRDARFSCRAIGRPPPLIVWHVNGLSRPGLVTMVAGQNESVLILRNVSRLDSGRVDCSASNHLSTVNRQFLLQVTYKPILSVPFHYAHFRLHDIATITCQVCSLPSTTIFDFFRPKQSTPIIEGVKEKFDEFLNQTCKQLTIAIYLSETSLFGTYVCRARNVLGITHAEFTLKEFIQSTKQMKYVTARRPLSTLFMVVNSSLSSIEQQKKSSERSSPSSSTTSARQEPRVVHTQPHLPASSRPARHDELIDD